MRSTLTLALLLSLGTSISYAGLINGGFTTPLVTSGTPFIESFDGGRIKTYDQSHVTGWETTDTGIEIWSDGALGFSAYTGYTQWAEINAYVNGTLSQTVTGITVGQQFGFEFAHRGRGSATVEDVVRVYVVDLGTDNAVGGGDDVVLLDRNYGDTNAAWGFYAVNLGTRLNSNNIRLSFEAVSTGNGDPSYGNFITALALAEGVGQVPEPASVGLVACGGVLVAALRRRKSRKA